MADYFTLPLDEQREALLHAAHVSGRPPHLLEKDLWVVWALGHLFTAPYAQHLVFKGGTSLSKAYDVIHRFSEDIDLTYDIREIAGDLINDPATPLPASKSQEKRWTEKIRDRLHTWIETNVVPGLQQAIATSGLSATARHEAEKVFIDYTPHTQGTGYVHSSVLLEFGARSTGEPHELRPIRCDAAAHLPEIAFPEAMPQVMRPERTFWEKATAIHVFCLQGRFRGGDRFARHWHDLTRLDGAGYATSARRSETLAHSVAKHKQAFFQEKGPDGTAIDYLAAVSGGLRLVPEHEAREKLADDYQRMIEDGLFLDAVEPFASLMDQCQRIEDQMNRRAAL